MVASEGGVTYQDALGMSTIERLSLFRALMAVRKSPDDESEE